MYYIFLGHSSPTLAGIALAYNELLLYSWLIVSSPETGGSQI